MEDIKAAAQILDSPNIVCPKCGCKTFTEAMVLKKVSALISPTGKEEIYPIPVFVCSKCGELPDEFMTKQNSKRVLGIKEEKSSLTI